MKIYIKSEHHNLRLYLPTGLIFSKTIARLGWRFGLQYAEGVLKGISPEAMETLFAEFRRIKRKHGSWELANVEGADGQMVRIIL